MSFRVEHVSVEWNETAGVVGKQEIEVFECLTEPEALHLVAMLRAVGRLDVSD